ncbi:hypothetical protein OG900_09480 [Streptomyces sp. NBC_00433]
MADLPTHLVDLQRRVNAARMDVETHRKEVDKRRVQEADDADKARKAAGEEVPEVPRWARRLPEWTAEDDAKHMDLMAAVIEAAAALRAGVIADPGASPDYKTAQALHGAARVSAEE